ncbi:hypothetical protein [Kaarinaea lacus]
MVNLQRFQLIPRLLFFSALVCASLIFSSLVFSGKVSAKPSSPITISIQAERTPQVNESVEFVVLVSSITDTPSLTVQVTPPNGMTLHDGDLLWQGAIAAGEIVRLRFSASFAADAEAVVSAIATVHADNTADNAAQMSARAEYRWGQNINRAAAIMQPQPVTRGEQQIIEFELER